MGFRHSIAVLAISLTSAAAAEPREYVVLAGRAPAPDADLVRHHWQAKNPRQDLPASGQSVPNLVYFTGPVARRATGLTLVMPSKELPVSLVLAGDETVLILNTCGTETRVSASDLPLRGKGLVAFPTTETCAPEALAQAVLTVLDRDPSEWEAGLGTAGLVVEQPLPEPEEGPEPGPLRAVENDSIIITTTLSPKRDTGPRILAQEVSARGEGIPAAKEAVQGAVLQSLDPPLVEGGGDRLVQPRRAGLPEPSVIIGENAASLPEVLRGPMGVAYVDRAAIRATDATRYARMVSEGAFDPDPAQIAAAIQTELQRMNCYASGVDGIWGRGSVAGAERYFREAKANMPGTQADLALYRALIGGPDLSCPTPMVAPTTAATTRSPTTSRGQTAPTGATGTRRTGGAGTSNRPRAEPPQPSTPQAPARTGGPRIDPSFGGSGVFR